MRHHLLFSFFILLFFFGKRERVQAQDHGDGPTRLLRISEDNDFINIWGRGTDDSYTNGTFLNYFYTKQKPSRWFIDRLMPKAGDSSNNVYGWGLNEMMYTPNDLTVPVYQPDDYSYSSALYATHTLYSYDPVKKYDFQTELVLGVMGPAAMGRQIQSLIHSVMDFQKPLGWGTQFGTSVLANINFTAEKQLASLSSSLVPGLGSAAGAGSQPPIVEVIGGGRVYVGTMMNAVTVYPLIRIGIMKGYFSGYLNQYGSGQAGKGKNSNHVQFYLFIKPEATLVISNALLEGALFNDAHHHDDGKRGTVSGQGQGQGTVAQPGNTADDYHPPLHRVITTMNFGAVASLGHISASFLQNTSSAVLKGVYRHQYGNISVYYSW
jgi:lipid A 3-O-deacylase